MEQLVQQRGPITAYRLARLTGYKRSYVNALLHTNLHFVKTERSPLSHVTARPVWSWSDTPVTTRPPARTHINSRNKTARRKAKMAYEEKVKNNTYGTPDV